MSNNQVVIDTLVKKREQLLAEKTAAISRYDAEIQELETALETLAGKKVWKVAGEVIIADLNPDYIKSSPEEL